MEDDNSVRVLIAKLFASFAGQNKTLTIPRPYIDLCDGDHLQALLLSQIIYWGDRTNDPHGWFAKSYTDWHNELGMTEYQVRRAMSGDKRAKNRTEGLHSLGVETKVAQSPFYEMKPTVHYRVNFTKLSEAILNIVKGYPQTMLSMDTEQSKVSSYTESTTESKPKKPKPDDKKETFTILIQAWLETQKSPNKKPYGNETVRATAKALYEQGVRGEDVTAYILDVRSDVWWTNKFVKFEKLENEILSWKENNKPRPPAVPASDLPEYIPDMRPVHVPAYDPEWKANGHDYDG